jgi:cobaltochelatase CobT
LFTDGAAVDDSTIGVQDGSFLQNHFQTIVRKIEAEDNIKLQLIGIEYDTSFVSHSAVTVTDGRYVEPVLSILRMLINRT